MANRLVIVESPAKAKTIGKYLGRAYTVKASMGHIRDLPKSKLGVDTEHDFAPQYLIPRDKSKTVKDLKQSVESAREVYLATDPDREGEAIAWHLAHATGLGDDSSKTKRVVFHEITPEAVKEAIAHPRALDMNLVDAYQARRVLDRLVGYNISPILWKKVKSGLSAGRVQSVALRLVVDREREIEAFDPVEYWTIGADLSKIPTGGKKATRISSRIRVRTRQTPHRWWPIWKARRTRSAKDQSKIPTGGKKATRKDQFRRWELFRVRGKKAELANEADSAQVVTDLEGASYRVAEVKKRETQRRPSAPFITSTLQQEASRKLNFNARRAMGVAQSLYEGVRLGSEGEQGLITYMRTDSTNVAFVAQQEARGVISARFGPEYVPEKAPLYSRKAKNAQEAHEAIRPTSVRRDPEAIKQYLTSDQYKLYKLIWQRFVASQMQNATRRHDRGHRGRSARTGGSVYVSRDRLGDQVRRLPRGVPGGARRGADERTSRDLLARAGAALQPPPRYSEATLVKILEELFAPVMGRSATTSRAKASSSADGAASSSTSRTCRLHLAQEELDEISSGSRTWVPVIRCSSPFEDRLQTDGTREDQG